MVCLFCIVGHEFDTVEHIIPEALGNDELVLNGEVCNRCQNYLSQIEGYVLGRTPIGFWRTFLTIKNKKGKLPSVSFNKREDSKLFPDFHETNDNVTFKAHDDYSTELVWPDKDELDEKGEIKYVITPRVVFELGRFLGKIGLELVCSKDRVRARSEEFREIRNYVRYGTMGELWPIFHETRGGIDDLVRTSTDNLGLKADVELYAYQLSMVGPYEVLSLKTGTDLWSICLNQQFPHPSLNFHLGGNTKFVWYSRKQFRS